MNLNEIEDPFEQLSCVPVHLLFMDWFPLFWWFLRLKLSLGGFRNSVICISIIYPRAKPPRITSLSDWGFWSFWKTLFCLFPPQNSSDPLRFGLILLMERFVMIWTSNLEITLSSRAEILVWVIAVWPVTETGLTGRSNRSDRSGISNPA